MLAYGERDGFTVKNVDNYAGHIEYGEGDETLGIFGHMDVVPAGDGWETDPYEPVIKDGKIMHVVQAMIKAKYGCLLRNENYQRIRLTRV